MENRKYLKNIKKLLHSFYFDGLDQFRCDLLSKFSTQYYFVGGCVRDIFIEGSSINDIDIVVPNIDIDSLSQLLSKYGKVDHVGKSFGVLKFKPFSNDQTFDVSVPRKEVSNGLLHTDFDVSIDNVSLDDDLYRRDFTINTLLLSQYGELIDKLGGLSDLKNKKLRTTSHLSFMDDPLRILRGIQFASRFNFKHPFDDLEVQQIKKHRHLLSTISEDRCAIELRKFCRSNVSNDDIVSLFEYLGIIVAIDDKKNNLSNNSLSHLLFKLGDCVNTFDKKHHIYSIDGVFKIKLTNSEAKLFEAFKYIKNNKNNNENLNRILYNAIQISNDVVNFKIYDFDFEVFSTHNKPTKISQLNINGFNLIDLGLDSKEVGLELNRLLDLVLSDKIENNHSILIKEAKKIV